MATSHYLFQCLLHNRLFDTTLQFLGIHVLPPEDGQRTIHNSALSIGKFRRIDVRPNLSRTRSIRPCQQKALCMQWLQWCIYGKYFIPRINHSRMAVHFAHSGFCEFHVSDIDISWLHHLEYIMYNYFRYSEFFSQIILVDLVTLSIFIKYSLNILIRYNLNSLYKSA